MSGLSALTLMPGDPAFQLRQAGAPDHQFPRRKPALCRGNRLQRGKLGGNPLAPFAELFEGHLERFILSHQVNMVSTTQLTSRLPHAEKAFHSLTPSAPHKGCGARNSSERRTAGPAPGARARAGAARKLPAGYGVITTRPTTLPSRRSFSAALTCSSGRVATGTSGAPVRFTSSSSSAISPRLPT